MPPDPLRFVVGIACHSYVLIRLPFPAPLLQNIFLHHCILYLFYTSRTSSRVVPIKNGHSKKEKVVINDEWHSKRSASRIFTQPNMSRTSIPMLERKTQPTRVPTRPKVMNTSFTSNRSSRRKREQPTANCSSPGFMWHRLEARARESHLSSDDVSPHPAELSSTLSRSSSLDHDRASMENNASSKSRHSTSSDLESSMTSNLSGSLRGSGDRPGSEDYLDNFPYAPPNRKPIPKHIIDARWSVKPK